jgi:hypothetical protein
MSKTTAEMITDVQRAVVSDPFGSRVWVRVDTAIALLADAEALAALEEEREEIAKILHWEVKQAGATLLDRLCIYTQRCDALEERSQKLAALEAEAGRGLPSAESVIDDVLSSDPSIARGLAVAIGFRDLLHEAKHRRERDDLASLKAYAQEDHALGALETVKAWSPQADDLADATAMAADILNHERRIHAAKRQLVIEERDKAVAALAERDKEVTKLRRKLESSRQAHMETAVEYGEELRALNLAHEAQLAKLEQAAQLAKLEQAALDALTEANIKHMAQIQAMRAALLRLGSEECWCSYDVSDSPEHEKACVFVQDALASAGKTPILDAPVPPPALAALNLAHDAQVQTLRAALERAFRELDGCKSNEPQERVANEFRRGHWCSPCDSTVDRNSVYRDEIRAVLASAGKTPILDEVRADLRLVIDIPFYAPPSEAVESCKRIAAKILSLLGGK